jgi:hypothetical protein
LKNQRSFRIFLKNCFSAILLLVVSACPLFAAAAVEPFALDIAGIYKIGDLDPNLTGKGVNIGLVCRSDTYTGQTPRNDYRPDISHNCFKDLKIKFHDSDPSNAGVSAHSTAIASILTGMYSDANLPGIGRFDYEGACPDAKLNVYEFRQFLSECIFAGNWPGDDLFTMSLGWSVEDWWSRGIDRMAEEFGLLVIASIGNGTDAHDLPLYPAAGANVLAVGVADSNSSLKDFNSPVPNRSTAGPTLDGRCKPDIIAPGNCLVAVAGKKNDFAATGDYSSFAAPVVASVAALLIQKANTQPELTFAVSPVFGNCVMKSILMTAAKKLPGWHKGFDLPNDDSEYPLDLRQGAGMLDGLSAYNLLLAGMQTDGNVPPSGWSFDIIEPNYTAERVYQFKTEKPVITATLIWNRPYSRDYPFEPLWQNLADFQLELWKLDQQGGQTLIDFSDSPVDNVEHLYLKVEPNTKYKLIVSHSLNSALPQTFTPYAISWQTK